MILKPFFYLMRVFFLLLIMITLNSVLLPGYPDEFAYLRLHQFDWQNLPTLSSNFPNCTSAQNIPVPLLLWPGKYAISSVFSIADSIVTMRAIGLLFLVLLFFLMGRLIRTLPLTSNQFASLHITCLGIISLGVMPFINSLIRPEILMVNIIVSLLLLTLDDYFKTKFALKFSLFVFLVGLLFILHPKALIFLPFLIVCALLLFRNSKKYLLPSSLVFIFFIAFQAYNLHTSLLSCKEYSSNSTILWNQYLDPFLLFRDPVQFFKQAILNFLSFDSYIRSVSFQKTHLIGWLPNLPVTFFYTTTSKLVNVLVIGVLSSLLISTLALLIFKVYKSLYPLKRMSPTSWLSLSLGFSLIVLVGLQTSKHFYETALLFPCLLLMFILLISESKFFQTILTKLMFLTAVTSILSMTFLLLSYGPNRIKGHAGPNTPLTVQRDPIINTSINEAMLACGITNDVKTTRVVVDDLTFLSVRKTKEPLFITYLIWMNSISSEATNKTLLDLIIASRANAILVKCDLMPELLQSDQKKFESICCIAKDDILNHK